MRRLTVLPDTFCDADDRVVDHQAPDRGLLIVLDRDGAADGCGAQRVGGVDAYE